MDARPSDYSNTLKIQNHSWKEYTTKASLVFFPCTFRPLQAAVFYSDTKHA